MALMAERYSRYGAPRSRRGVCILTLGAGMGRARPPPAGRDQEPAIGCARGGTHTTIVDVSLRLYRWPWVSPRNEAGCLPRWCLGDTAPSIVRACAARASTGG